MSNIWVETDTCHQILTEAETAMALGQHATLGYGWIRLLGIVHGDAVLHRRAARQHGIVSPMSQIIIAAMVAAIKHSAGVAPGVSDPRANGCALRIAVLEEGNWCCRSGLN